MVHPDAVAEPPLEPAECCAFLNFLSVVVGFFLPLILVLKTESPASLQQWEERWMAGDGGARGCRGVAGTLAKLAAGTEYSIRMVVGRRCGVRRGAQGRCVACMLAAQRRPRAL